ncbi:hypothetical protein [Weissella cibaria]|uniref:hypothetical protein n=1 Tax=Weissella cibaria TaxID=137591 RepID=UPI001C1FB17A|nr:hypothetical protein [Weissella cibaria]MBU7545487.1 hypothetical protein [Weissella cibaria]MCV3318755.1 hypothetical protein [Weissella cibaria]
MYKAHVYGTMTFHKDDTTVDRLRPFGELEMFDVEADTLAQLVQKLAEHFGTDMKQFLAGYSDDDEKDSIQRTGSCLINESNGNEVHHAMKITCDGEPVYLSEHPELPEE